jgi:hypothetical protein
MGIVLDPTKCFLAHPNEEVLEEYVLYRLPEALLAQVEEHLLLCESCQNAVAGTDSFVAAMKIAADPPTPWRGFLPSLPNRTQLASMAALVILTLVALWPHPPEPSAPVPVSLSSLRGSNVLAPAPAGKPLRLGIDQPDLVPTGVYRIQVVDAAGGPIWKGPVSDVDGKLVATLSQPLRKGVYWVRLYGADSEVLREFGIFAQ